MTDDIVELSDREAEQLARRIAKARPWDRWDPLEERADWDGERAVLLAWELYRRAAIDLAELPSFWPELAEYPALAPPALVVRMLGAIQRFEEDDEPADRASEDRDEDWDDEEDWDAEEGADWDGEEEGYEDGEDGEEREDGEDDEVPFPWELDTLAFVAWVADSKAFAGWREFPEPVRRGVAFAALRAGVALADEQRVAVRAELARVHIQEGLPVELHAIAEDGSSEATRRVVLYDDDNQRRQPSAHFQAIVDALGGPEAWARALLDAALRTPWSLSPHRSLPAGRVADLDGLAHIIAAYSADAAAYRTAYRLLREDRSDDYTALLGLAGKLTECGDQRAADVARTVAVLRQKAADAPVPEDFDAGFGARGWFLDELAEPPGFVGLAETLEALRYLGQARAYAIIDRALDRALDRTQNDGEDPCAILPPLAAFPEQARIGAVLQAALPHLDSARGIQVFGWRPLGDAAIPVLLDAYVREHRAGQRDCLHLALLHLFAGQLEAGQPVDPALDEVFHFRNHEELDGYRFHCDVVPPLTRILRLLPAERATAVIERGLDPEYRYWARPFEVLAELPLADALPPAFAALGAHADRLKQPYHDGVGQLVRDHPEQTMPLCRLAMEASRSSALAEIFENALGADRFAALMSGSRAAGIAAETPLGKLQRVAGVLAEVGDLVRIYVLETDRQRAAEPADVNRVGSRPIGVTAQTWPTSASGVPMDHLFTLRLADIPELQERYPDAAALALFIESRDLNEAYEPYNGQTQLVQLSAEELAAGEPSAPPEASHGGGAAGARTRDVELYAHPFALTAVDVPSVVFFMTPERIADDERTANLRELRTLVYSLSARVLGEPIWLQDDEDPGSDFLMQFDDGFTDVNLGDMGVMYVYDDTAFWQCH